MRLTMCVETISLKCALQEPRHCCVWPFRNIPNQANYFLAMMLSCPRQACRKATPSDLSYLLFPSMTMQGQSLQPLTFGTLLMRPLAVPLRVFSIILPTYQELTLTFTSQIVKLSHISCDSDDDVVLDLQHELSVKKSHKLKIKVCLAQLYERLIVARVS